MQKNQYLLHHPFWAVTDPEYMRLVRIFELPSGMNPFASEGVVLKVASAVGESPYHKWPMARGGILDGIKKGHIGPKTKVVEATSGNTGLGMSVVCRNLGLNFTAVIADDIPGSKVDAIRVLGGVPLRNPDHGETTAECARRLGAQEGWYNPDQYSGDWNPRAHREHLMPQLFAQTRVSVLVAPGGTMATCMAAAQYARDHELNTTVIPVMCEEGQEIPAARTLARVKKDVRLPWEQFFAEKDVQLGTRYASFLLSYLTWRFIPAQLGPSFGLACVGALKFLRMHQNADTLEQFRDTRDGKIHMVIFGPDDYRPYIGLYLDKPFYDDRFVRGDPEDLLKLIDMA